jgi:nucleotide-binding universal stress UspA family protein
MEPLKINRILIPVDFSETGLLALEHGAFMARIFKADLFLLHVIEMAEFAFNVYDPILLVTDEKDEEKEEAASENLQELSEKIAHEYNVHVTPLISRGKVVSRITEAAKNNNIDLIVMGTHGAQGVKEYFMGSNAHKTVSAATCPVITVQTHAQKLGFSTIVLPIDDSFHSREKVDLVLKLASKYAAQVHILGLINPNEDIDEHKFNMKIDLIENVIKKTGLPYIRKIIRGKNLAMEAMKYSNNIKADLIAIMTDEESNLNDPLISMFSQKIVNHSQIPVISIKPKEPHYENNEHNGNPFG